MDKDVVYKNSGVLFCHKGEQNNVIFRKMDRTSHCHINLISQTQKDKYHKFSLLCVTWGLGGGEDMKIESRLLGKRKGTRNREDYRKSGYDQKRLITLMKLSQ